MDFLTLLIIIYAIKSAIEDTRSGWRTSKAAYMRSADARFPDAPKSRRAARALQHDTGYWTAQALRGFPGARRGFTAGWREGRQAQAEGKPVPRRPRSLRRPAPGNDIDGTCLYCSAEDGQECKPDCPYGQMNWREVDRIKRERAERATREGSGEGSPGFPVLLRVRSKSGRKLNPITGAPEDVATVYDAEDLQRRLDAAAGDPDIEVTTEPLPRIGYLGQDGRWHGDEPDPAYGMPSEPAQCGTDDASRHRHCSTPGCPCPCHATTEPPAVIAGQVLGTQPERSAITEGTSSMGYTTEVTYTEQLDELIKLRDQAEQELIDVRARRMVVGIDRLANLGLDSRTLSDIAAVDDAMRKQEEAAREALEAAQSARDNLRSRHGGIQEAVDNSSVDVPAEPGFYSR